MINTQAITFGEQFGFNTCVMLLLLVSFLCLSINLSECCSGNTFKDVSVQVEYETGAKNLTITGCIGPDEDFLNAKKIHCKGQNVIVLQRNAVTDLHKLENLHFESNGMVLVMPGSLSNLTNTSTIVVTGNKLAKLVKGTFSNIPVNRLDLAYNHINSIDNGAFSNLPNLTDIILSRNKIKEWNKEWFDATPKLKSLILTDNLIETLPANAFKSFAISTIKLNRNRIHTLDSKTFAGLYHMWELDLGENRLEELPKDVFASFSGEPEEEEESSSEDFYRNRLSLNLRSAMSGIITLNIYGNNLTYLPERMLERDLKNVWNLNVHSNPWQCACYMKIERWRVEGNRRIDSGMDIGCRDTRNPVCVYPDEGGDVCQEKVLEEVIRRFRANFKRPKPNIFDRNIRCY